MSNALLDSSIIIDFLRINDKTKTQLYQFNQSDYQLSISMIVYSELYSGKSVWESKKELTKLLNILSGIKILPLNRNISKQAGRIRAYYGTSLFDAIIAATAIDNNIPLATINIKDFHKIKGLKLIKLPL